MTTPHIVLSVDYPVVSIVISIVPRGVKIDFVDLKSL